MNRKLLIWVFTLAVTLLLVGHVLAQTQPLLSVGNSSPAGSLVVRGTGGVLQTTTGPVQLSGLTVTWSSSAVRALEVFDAGTLPANGAVTPAYCYVINGTAGSALGSVTVDWTVHPLRTLTGMVLAVSTNTAGCTQLTVDGTNDIFNVQAVAP